MRPATTTLHAAYQHLADAISRGGVLLPLCAPQGPYFSNLLVSQLGEVIIRAIGNPTPSPAFDDHVGRIVGVCAEKKMVWVYTQPHIAAVANAHSLRNFTPCDLEGQAMHHS